MKIRLLPALTDNYIYIWKVGKKAVIVDPGEAKCVLDYLEENNLEAGAILITHVHYDHVDGIGEIVDNYPNVKIYGPKEVKHLAENILQDGDKFDLYGSEIKVFLTAGHSEGHITYLVDGKHLLCGDALFSAGCGRIFTENYVAGYKSMEFFRNLNEDVKVYSGHEYTLTNLKFSMTQISDDFVKKYFEKMKSNIDKGFASLPSTIGIEKKINPLLMANNIEEFIRLRKLRDNF